MDEKDLGAFEMLWDCPSCDQKGLLGKSQRFCPSCGAAQDPKSRYFPSEEQKVAVKDHEFFGADVVCPGCDVPNSKKAEFCVACGTDLKKAKTAATRGDQEAAAGASFNKESAKDARTEHKNARLAREAASQGGKPAAPAGPPPKSRKMLYIGLGVGGSLLLLLILFFTMKKEAQITVIGHQWRRTIGIEKFMPKNDSEWCDKLPSDAYAISRKSEVRSQKKVPDGKECKKVRKDRGDGTFKETEKCETKYRDEPVYDNKCYFQANRWQLDRTLDANGTGTTPSPRWPDVSGLRLGAGIGAEREMNRKESYTLTLKTPDNKTTDCDYDEAVWASFPDGTSRKAKVRMMGGGVDCASFVAVAK